MKGAEDERDAWPATIAAVALLRPKWFIGENVRGVEAHLDGYVVPALRALGYVVSWRVLNAADYGVPQTRQRVILVAGPVAMAMAWPRATHGDPGALRPLFDWRKPWRSMGEALGIEAIGGVVDWSAPQSQRVYPTASPAPTVDCGSTGGRRAFYVIDPKHPPAQPDRSAPTIRSGGSGHSAPPLYVTAAGETGEGRPRPMTAPSPTLGTKGTAYLLTRPSPCVCATEAKGHTNPDRERGRANSINRASDANYLITGRRRLTWQECAILQDFPADYPWQGGITERYRQIGNAVPPTLARVLGGATP